MNSINPEQVKTVDKQCPNCMAIFPVPEKSGCTICPRCGQRSCGE